MKDWAFDRLTTRGVDAISAGISWRAQDPGEIEDEIKSQVADLHNKIRSRFVLTPQYGRMLRLRNELVAAKVRGQEIEQEIASLQEESRTHIAAAETGFLQEVSMITAKINALRGSCPQVPMAENLLQAAEDVARKTLQAIEDEEKRKLISQLTPELETSLAAVAEKLGDSLPQLGITAGLIALLNRDFLTTHQVISYAPPIFWATVKTRINAGELLGTNDEKTMIEDEDDAVLVEEDD